MTPEDHLIDANTFIFYADYYATTAIAGIRRAQEIFEAINPALRVNTSTFDVFDSADLSTGNLINTIRLAYDTTFTEASSLQPMASAFTELAAHIKKWTGGTVNQFLTSEGIEVAPIYARISGLLGEPISNSNTRDA